jgi:hypothetical protein
MTQPTFTAWRQERAAIRQSAPHSGCSHLATLCDELRSYGADPFTASDELIALVWDRTRDQVAA